MVTRLAANASSQCVSSPAPFDTATAQESDLGYDICPYTDWHGDDHGTVTFESLKKGNAALTPLATVESSKAAKSGWMRIRIRMNSNAQGWVLALTTRTKEGAIYYTDAAGDSKTLVSGTDVGVAQRVTLITDRPILLLTPEMTGSDRLYLYVRTPLEGDAHPRLYKLNQLARREGQLAVRYSAFAGIFLPLCIIGMLLFAFLRERLYVYNALMMFAAFGYQVVSSGLPGVQFWSGIQFDLTASQAFMIIVYFAAANAFATEFLKTRAIAPRLFSLSWAAVGIVIVLDALQTVLPNLDSSNIAGLTMQLTWGSIILVAASVARREKVRSAGYFTVGYACLMIGLTVGGAYYIDVFRPLVSSYGIAFLAFPVAALLDAVLFQVAIADRISHDRTVLLKAQANELAAEKKQLALETKRVEELEALHESFYRFVPHDFVTALGREVETVILGDHVEKDMTVLFSDIRSFTTLSEGMSPAEVFTFLNDYLAIVGPVIRRHGGFVDKYIGDGVMALFADSPGGAIDAAIDIQRGVVAFNAERGLANKPPIKVGVGIHRGLLMLGTIGESQRYDSTVIAGVVNVASRLEGLTKYFQTGIVVSESVFSAVDPSRYHFRPLCDGVVKGTLSPIGLFEVFDADHSDLLHRKRTTIEGFCSANASYRACHFADAIGQYDALRNPSYPDGPLAFFRERAADRLKSGTDQEWDGIERFEFK